MYTVSLNEFIKKMKVVNLTPEVDIENIEITQTDTNRPALQLADFFDYFDNHRCPDHRTGGIYLYGKDRCREKCPDAGKDHVL